ncbi:hypothetical protein AMK17_25185 [Streptomyces sp. CB00072]|uniref:hypothetical protein n=1 Tax=Streptomyces sp. CB00072 TaxID=1703928 RepID=UPI00093E647F|nr:hypothetical protein [Streptomyces sp. CB00072]OKI54308.1 hypothetical protein AMK17_25185 [Streptomyces sp. CB00072]
MNAKRINAAAGVVLAAQKSRQTAAGIAAALEAAGLLQSPESAAERAQLQDDITGACLARYEEEQDAKRARFAAKLARKRAFDLRAERDAFADWADTLAYAVAPVEVLGRHGEEGKYPWGDALELITPVAEVAALRARVAELEGQRDRRRVRLVALQNDALNMRGSLAPNGEGRKVPFELGETLTPAVDWLINRVAELEGQANCPSQMTVSSGTSRCALPVRHGGDHRNAEKNHHWSDEYDDAVRVRPVEDPHDSPLHHSYALGRDLPEVSA